MPVLHDVAPNRARSITFVRKISNKIHYNINPKHNYDTKHAESHSAKCSHVLLGYRQSLPFVLNSVLKTPTTAQQYVITGVPFPLLKVHKNRYLWATKNSCTNFYGTFMHQNNQR